MYAKTTLVLVTAVTVLTFVAAINASAIITLSVTPVFAVQGQKFIAKLTGQNEVPPKNTKATGSFEMELSADGSISNYVLNVTNISNVVSAQIHQGEKDTNGPVIQTLYPFHPRDRPIDPKSLINGTITNGTLSKEKVYTDLFEGPFTGKHISDLIILINSGKAYVNIYTKENPQGEIRGQLSAKY
jgi:hypothetical protein